MPVELAGVKPIVARCTEDASKTSILFKQFVSEVQQDITAVKVAEKRQ